MTDPAKNSSKSLENQLVPQRTNTNELNRPWGEWGVKFRRARQLWRGVRDRYPSASNIAKTRELAKMTSTWAVLQQTTRVLSLRMCRTPGRVAGGRSRLSWLDIGNID